MMFTIGKAFSFAAAHHLEHLPADHKCHRVHGHNYTVQVALASDGLDPNGFVLDYGLLAPFREYVDGTLDHQDLNEVLGFPPTAELLAQHLHRVATQLLTNANARGFRVLSVVVAETPTTFAEYRP